MADQAIQPPKTPPADDYARATFEQVMFGVTGLGVDLHQLADTHAGSGGVGWFKFLAEESARRAATAGNYTAWGTVFYGVDYNLGAIEDWGKAYAETDDYVQAMARGKLGLMDVQSLRAAHGVLGHYIDWLIQHQITLASWEKALDSEDSEFKGRAAFAIRQNIRQIRFVMDDLIKQLLTARKPAPGGALLAATDRLMMFDKAMAGFWNWYRDSVRSAVHTAMKFVTDSIHAYIWGAGLVAGTDNYILRPFSSREQAEPLVINALARYDSRQNQAWAWTVIGAGGIAGQYGTWELKTFEIPTPPKGMPHVSGDLASAATWDGINAAVTTYVKSKLNPLDVLARVAMESLGKAYDLTKTPLARVYQNKPPALGSPPPTGSDNPFDVPDLDGGLDGLGPPDLDLGPPGGPDTDIGPPPDLDLGAGGTAAPPGTDPFDPGGFDTGSSTSPGGGLGEGDPDSGSGWVPPLPPPPPPPSNGSTRNPEPPDFAPPDLDVPGGPLDPDDDGWTPPDLDELPPVTPGSTGGGTATMSPPPGLDAGGGGLPASSGVGTALGAGFGDTPGTGGVRGSGEGWADWSGQPGTGPAPGGTPVTAPGQSGMPMMPPMMPPMMGGAGAGDNKERERQTWLAEDEKVWGAGTTAGNGVIGRPDADEHQVDEQPVRTHVHVRSAPRGRTTEQTAQPATPAQSATGR